jgi:uncharacterized protein
MIEDSIYKAYTDALRNKQRERLEFLNFVRAEIKNSALALRKDKLDDNETLAVLKKIKKNIDEAKETFVSSGRSDLINKATEEIAILAEYLPQPLSQEELAGIISEVITRTGATSMKDMGKVMKETIAQIGVRADSKMVSDLVKQKLSPRP